METKEVFQTEAGYAGIYKEVYLRTLIKNTSGLYRSELHHTCGYVLIPKNHIMYGVSIDYDETYNENARLLDDAAYGGVTLSQYNKEYDKWCFGFDTMHGGRFESYCNRMFTMGVIEKMARFLKEIEG